MNQRNCLSYFLLNLSNLIRLRKKRLLWFSANIYLLSNTLHFGGVSFSWTKRSLGFRLNPLATLIRGVYVYKILHLRAGMHNSNLMAGQKLFVFTFMGQNLHVFNIFKRCFWGVSKLNCGLCGPAKKLSRATFGPRAVCCARLP
jgi:hypothetical protein